MRKELRSKEVLRLGGGAGHCLRTPPTEGSVVPTESLLEVLSLVVLFGAAMSLGKRTSTLSPGCAYTWEFQGPCGWREGNSSDRTSVLRFERLPLS